MPGSVFPLEMKLVKLISSVESYAALSKPRPIFVYRYEEELSEQITILLRFNNVHGHVLLSTYVDLKFLHGPT